MWLMGCKNVFNDNSRDEKYDTTFTTSQSMGSPKNCLPLDTNANAINIAVVAL